MPKTFDNQTLTEIIQGSDIESALKERLIRALPKMTMVEKGRLVLNLKLTDLTHFIDQYEQATGEPWTKDAKKSNLKLLDFLMQKADQAKARRLTAKLKQESSSD